MTHKKTSHGGDLCLSWYLTHMQQTRNCDPFHPFPNIPKKNLNQSIDLT